MPCSLQNFTDALRNFTHVYSIHLLGMCKCLQCVKKTEFVTSVRMLGFLSMFYVKVLNQLIMYSVPDSLNRVL